MNDGTIPLIVGGFLILALVFRLIAGAMDGDRLTDYLKERGATLISKEWAPFGKGWYGTENERIYTISYRDRDGHEHHAQCKTSLFAGVYLTDDTIVKHARVPEEGALPSVRRPLLSSEETEPGSEETADDRLAQLEAENGRLRDEIERLRGA